MKIHSSIEIKASPQEIWSYLVNPEKILKWCTPINIIRYTGERRGGIGTAFYFEEKALGRLMKMNFVVTEWVECKSVAYRMTSGNIVKGYEQRYTIESIDNGIRLTCFENVKLPYGILGKIVGLFRSSTSRDILGEMLLNLKTIAEA